MSAKRFTIFLAVLALVVLGWRKHGAFLSFFWFRERTSPERCRTLELEWRGLTAFYPVVQTLSGFSGQSERELVFSAADFEGQPTEEDLKSRNFYAFDPETWTLRKLDTSTTQPASIRNLSKEGRSRGCGLWEKHFECDSSQYMVEPNQHGVFGWVSPGQKLVAVISEDAVTGATGGPFFPTLSSILRSNYGVFAIRVYRVGENSNPLLKVTGRWAGNNNGQDQYHSSTYWVGDRFLIFRAGPRGSRLCICDLSK